MNLNSTESSIISKPNYRDLIIFIVPILIFSLYLFVYNPGVLTVASYSQLHQIATGEFTNAHPIFHTLLEILFLKLFKSPFYIGLFQIIIFSLIWTVICKYHRDDYTKSSNEFVLQYIVTLIICLIPINAVYSITLSSNILFSYSIMFLCFLIKVMIDKNGILNTELLILMALTLVIMSGLNTYGIYIALLSLIVIFHYLYKNDTAPNTYTKFVGITIVCILLLGSLNLIYDVDNDTLNIQTNDAFEDGINLENAKNQFFNVANDKPTAEFENAASVNVGNSNYNLIDSFVNLFRDNFILDGLFNNPILYMLFSILLLVLIFIMTQSEEIFLVYVPVLLNIIVVALTGQNNLYSNLLVFYLIVIILINLWVKQDLKYEGIPDLTQTFNKSDKNEVQPISMKEKRYVEPVTTEEETYIEPITTEETYVEPITMEEDYIEEDDYSELETEIEELTFEEIDEMLGNSPTEEKQKEEHKSEEPDLIDEILKEIEMGKK